MDVDGFVESKVLAEFRPVARKVVALMREMAPEAGEGISYGIPMWKGKHGLAVLSPTKKGITFALSRGAEMEDKYGLLEGVGKVSKNVRMSSAEEFNEKALRYYIKQALAFDKR
jgi:hypothetical protein